MEGLTRVSTEELRTLLRAVHRGQIRCPLEPVGLASIGLQDRTYLLTEHMRGLDEPAVRAVIVAVIAERVSRP